MARELARARWFDDYVRQPVERDALELSQVRQRQALAEFGHLLETFVIGEVRKQASWLDEPVTLGQWRTSDGAEVG